MAERLVLCGEAGTSKGSPEALRLRLTGPQANIVLRLQDISRRMVETFRAS